jgi:CRISPR-associated endonuclease/helicase Cas3
MTPPLLAKSCPDPASPPPPATLAGHTVQVLDCAERILQARARDSLEAAGLPPELGARLHRIVCLAAFLHDLGKANDQFQAMVRTNSRKRQLLRHEALLLWLAWPGKLLGSWLEGGAGGAGDLRLALAAACGHHRRFPDDAIRTEGTSGQLTILAGHPDFHEILTLGARRLGLGAPPSLTDQELKESWRNPLKRHLDDCALQLDEELRCDSEAAHLLALAKALLVAADVAGSVLPRAGGDVGWLDEALTWGGEGLLDGVVSSRLKGAPLRPFQNGVAQSTAPVTLVRASCGTGKTIAAYAWAARQHSGRQLWICYPTTGTATEGFRDYLIAADIEASLEHSRAKIDLEILESAGVDAEDRWHRLEALRVWTRTAISCTADTVLSLLQNQRKGVYAWCGIARAAFVFDEIHAYDETMFGLLLRFLASLPGLPVLLMTASLPKHRLRALREVCSRHRGQELAELFGPSELERLPRYRLARTNELPWAEVCQELAAGGKVLWVSNTVDRCRNLASQAAEQGLAPLVYHSRFRYLDRVRRHECVIKAFRSEAAALAFTTQVAEMSLDLSATLLVSDLAPVPSLIQRLGRLNRYASPARPQPPGRGLFVDPPHPLPYAEGDLQAARGWLAGVGTDPCSQEDLAAAWRHEESVAPLPVMSNWLDGGFATSVGDVREASPGITILLPDDVASIASGELAWEAAALPMPRPPEDWVSWPRIRHLPVPPGGVVEYDAEKGARWRKR